ncbi:MAG: hypothetical protein JNK54_06505 [Elusimicrobia bacterium]|nr:hypothetical protein [Elusimicrobiota bacterium]
MNLRIEFMRTKSPVFDRIISVVRQFPTFKEWDSDGIHLYSVEFVETDFESARTVIDFVRGWKGVTYYRDGQLISKGTAYRAAFDEIFRKARRESELSRTYGNTPADFVRIQRRLKEREDIKKAFGLDGDGTEEP